MDVLVDGCKRVCIYTVADRRKLLLSEKKLCQVPNTNRVVVTTGGVNMSVFDSASSGRKHGSLMGDLSTNFFEAGVEFLNQLVIA